MKANSPSFQSGMGRTARLVLAAILLTSIAFGLGPAASIQAGTQLDIPGPAGSGAFGQVTVLPNGNIVVADPFYNAPGPITDVGAVYLYNGANRALISTLTGSRANDQVGNGGVTVLSNGSYVVVSSFWDNETIADAGAVTWGNGATGVSGSVSAANSLVGSSTGDRVGSGGVTALSSGNYVVKSPDWSNWQPSDAPKTNVGAVTWGNGATGISGKVAEANSLVGSTSFDRVGSSGVTVLSNGNYVVTSPFWDNKTVTDAGAATWGNGAMGVIGGISATDSLVGSTLDDMIGIYGATALSNGNYVVASPFWDDEGVPDTGAVTWGNGAAGASGPVSTANSLVGPMSSDQVGSGGVTALSNGNYVVASPRWHRGEAGPDAGAATWGDGTIGLVGAVSGANSLVGIAAGNRVGLGGVTPLTNGNYVVVSPLWGTKAAAEAGAVTWGNGATGASGSVTSANSLVGSTAYDMVGIGGVMALSNGNYVVLSANWDNGPEAAEAGAVTWGSGTAGVNGEVSGANSLVGATALDGVGSGGVTALSNGNYVVASPLWGTMTVANAGAATWGNGAVGVSGAVTAANSLVGSTASDFVGSGGVTALSNGNYVVTSPLWGTMAVANAGAATWGSGATGMIGEVSGANSLVGSTANDFVGSGGVTALSNGNYVVVSPDWANGAVANAGAATWGSGATGVIGEVSAANSLVGSTAGDRVGSGGVTALSNGNYVVMSPHWDNGAAANAGAITLGGGAVCPAGPTLGPITAANSVLGAAAGGGGGMNFAYDPVKHQLVVGRPADNVVSLFRDDACRLFMPLVKRSE